MGGMETDEENKFYAMLQTLDQLFGVEDKWDSLKRYGTEHPVITVVSMLILGICCVPVFCFGAFAFGSAVVTFSAFMLIEGTILTIGTFILGGVLCFIGMMSIGISLLFVMAFYAFQTSQRMMMRFSSNKEEEQLECDSSTKKVS